VPNSGLAGKPDASWKAERLDQLPQLLEAAQILLVLGELDLGKLLRLGAEIELQ
jgi:hypothetical protein